MSQEKKFIKTTDKETADKLISFGFQLVSQSGSAYTFLNQLPTNFTFNEVDKKKIVYSNTLNI
jgi:hypothetical protein